MILIQPLLAGWLVYRWDVERISAAVRSAEGGLPCAGSGSTAVDRETRGKNCFSNPVVFSISTLSQDGISTALIGLLVARVPGASLGGNISERNQVPFIDITATRSAEGQRVVVGITNRSPLRQAKVMVNLKGEGNRKFRVAEAQLMRGSDVLAANTVDAPEQVSVSTIRGTKLRFAWLDLDLPPASLMVVVLEKKG